MALKIRKPGRSSNSDKLSNHELIKLYQDKHLSMQQIADKYHISSATVWKRLHKLANKAK